MKIATGDIIHFPSYDSNGTTYEGNYYLILDTRKKFRYDALFLWDGKVTQLDKSLCQSYGEKVA
jgi:hypothetical protein